MAEEIDPPGVVWAGVATNDGWRFTIGKGLNDDRYIYRYTKADGFSKLFACPDFTGSYLSFDGRHLYLSQWYTGDIHQIDDSGKITHTVNVGAEICGHTFADGVLYVLRGKENKDVPNKAEEWRIARVSPDEKAPKVEDLASIPFASRSLTFDGKNFWSNHRAANETIAFALPPKSPRQQKSRLAPQFSRRKPNPSVVIAKRVMSIAGEEERAIQVNKVSRPCQHARWSDSQRGADHTAKEKFEAGFARALSQ